MLFMFLKRMVLTHPGDCAYDAVYINNVDGLHSFITALAWNIGDDRNSSLTLIIILSLLLL